jgi:putative flippase GtrA
MNLVNKFKHFYKFLVVGINNTAIDFLILNILMIIFKTYQQWPIIIFNIVSFSIAVINSYLLNRFWTFNQTEDKKIENIQLLSILTILLVILSTQFLKIDLVSILLIIIFFIQVFIVNYYIVRKYFYQNKGLYSFSQFSQFVLLTIVGMLINSSVLYFVSSSLTPWSGFSPIIWANFAKAIATIIALFWNFFAYRVIVFKRS